MSAVMESTHITPFIRATIRAFDTLFGWNLSPQTPEINTHFHPRHEISGVIGLSGKLAGTLVVSVEKEIAIAAAEYLTQQKFSEICEDVIDAMGEITNIIGGSAKAELATLGLSLSLPTVIIGKNHLVTFVSNARTVMVPFVCDQGRLTIEVGMTAR